MMPADPSGISSFSIVEFFDQYAAYAGVALALLSLLVMILLYGLLAMVKLNRRRATRPLLVILGFLPWVVFGYQLLYREPRYANIAKAIIEYLGEPMLYSGLIVVAISLLWLVFGSFKKSTS